MRQCIILFSILIITQLGIAQTASIHEEMMEMKTYPFSDPNPIPEINRIYPYYYFHGYTNTPEIKKWKMVVLENDYIKVFVCPDIGGKIWGAIEKSTGKEFLYFNHVVKFRDVAMRGAWTSGGLEYNFGDIGHIPTCATPVDYVTKNNADGSVSCVVGATDLPSGTKWNVEIIVQPDKAYFKTKVSWFNTTSLPCTYYHWMNAAAKSSGNLEFIYPGNKRIGHGGELGEWPNENEREINYYDNNDFGFYKSYHILNSYSNFFGGYWHEDSFGFGHWSNYDEKPGKKLWIWGLSQQGMIWEDLLTNDDGQYIEFQAGKLFNQAAHSSTFTPFKHKEFAPGDADIMNEIWFPLKNTGGMVAASEFAVLNVERDKKKVTVLISALQTINDTMLILEDNKLVSKTIIQLKPLEKKEIEFLAKAKYFTVQLGNNKLNYSSSPKDIIVNRPLETLVNFNWESAYGLFTTALEMEKQRRYEEAMQTYHLVLQKDAGYLPAINRLALAYYRKMNYKKALQYITQSLSIDTYDGEANYLYGLINKKLDNTIDSKSGFSMATASITYRVAAYNELAKLFLFERNFHKSLEYSQKAWSFNNNNPLTFQLMALAYRKMNMPDKAAAYLHKLIEIDKTNHFVRFERFMLDETEKMERSFTEHITNEMPLETYLELAVFYKEIACNNEAVQLLKMAPSHPITSIWLANLDSKNAEKHISQAISASPYLVFPFRNETAEILETLIANNDNWKLKYYLGLIYWNRGLESKTKDLFEACSIIPDFAPFYLAKAKLTDDADLQREYLLKATELDDNDWRTALALTKFYLNHKEAKRALAISKKFKDKYPEQASIGLSYAQSLLKLNNFAEAIEFLSSYNLLPFEGATIGRDIFHEACVRMAFDALRKKDYENVILWANKAREWPVNLGVGRPYDVDERLENYMIAQAYELSGKQKKADEYYQKIADHPNENFTNESSKLLLQLFVLKSLKQSSLADMLLSKILMKNQGSIYLQWVEAYYENRNESAKIIANKIQTLDNEIQPYDITYRDNEYQLLMDYFNEFVNRK